MIAVVRRVVVMMVATAIISNKWREGSEKRQMWYEESMWLEEGKLAEEKVQHPVIMDLLLEGKRRRGGRWGGRNAIGKDGGEKEEGRRLQ